MQLRGLYTALITPFDSQGKLDKVGLRRNLQHQLENEVDGILVLGTTAEIPTLSLEEQQIIIKIAVEEIKGKAALMVGTGSYSTKLTIEMTKKAEEMGADSALIVTPYYNKPTQEGLYRHFAAICESTSLPICIYNNPGRTAQNLKVETLQRLMTFCPIIGIKESSGNMMQIIEIIENAKLHWPHLSVLCGDDPSISLS